MGSMMGGGGVKATKATATSGARAGWVGCGLAAVMARLVCEDDGSRSRCRCYAFGGL